MACAESQFYADYPSTSSASLDNRVNGVLWFTYTNKRDLNILRKRNTQSTVLDFNISINNDFMNILSSNMINVEIFDVLGHSINRVGSTENNIFVSFKDFKPGIYTAVIDNAGEIITKKFVVL